MLLWEGNQMNDQSEMFRAMDAANRAKSHRESMRALAIVGFGFIGVIVCSAIAILIANFA